MFSVEDRHWWYVALHEVILALVAAEAKAKGSLQIFDAGCGTGRLATLLAPLGTVSGCDASAAAIAFCRQRGLSGMEQIALQQVTLPANHFDVITCIDVLYHQGIHDDVEILKRLRDALKPGGLLLIHLVAGPSLYSSHDVAVHSRERYTRPLLQGRLKEAGLVSVRLSYRLAILFPLIAAWRRLQRRKTETTPAGEIASDVALPSPLINAVLLSLMRTENWLLRHIDLPFGSSLLAICRREP